MARFNKPNTRIKVAGIGIVSNSNLTDEMAQRLISSNPKYAQLINLENGKSGKRGDSKRGSKSVEGPGDSESKASKESEKES